MVCKNRVSRIDFYYFSFAITTTFLLACLPTFRFVVAMATAGLRNSAERCCTQCACKWRMACWGWASPSQPHPPSVLQLRHGSLSEGAGTVPMQRDAPQPHAAPTTLEIPAHIHTHSHTNTLTGTYSLKLPASVLHPSSLVCPRSPLLSSLTVSLIAAPSAAALTHSALLFPI